MRMSMRIGPVRPEVSLKSKMEFEEGIMRHSRDHLPGMEIFLESPAVAPSDPFNPVWPDETAPVTTSEKAPITRPKNGPVDNIHPFIRFSNEHVYQTSVSEYHLPTIKEWKPFDPAAHLKVDMDKPRNPVDTLYALAGALLSIVALIIIATLLTRKKRNRRGVIPATSAAAFQRDFFTNLRYAAPAEPPLKNDLPPPYSECSPCSMNKRVDMFPPPYGVLEADQQPRQDAFINHERKVCAEVHTDMKKELVFNNGRVVERLSLQLNKETGGASDDEIEVQSTRVADITDKVKYVNETKNIKRDTQ